LCRAQRDSTNCDNSDYQVETVVIGLQCIILIQASGATKKHFLKNRQSHIAGFLFHYNPEPRRPVIEYRPDSSDIQRSLANGTSEDYAVQ
jgi:hypothetical protein